MSRALEKRIECLALAVGFVCLASVASAQTACPDLRALSPESFPVHTRILSATLATVPAADVTLAAKRIVEAFANYLVAQQFMRYLAFEKTPGPLDSDPLKFDFERGPASLARARTVYDATSVDLRAFKARGGKILMWHGWADTSIPAGSSI